MIKVVFFDVDGTLMTGKQIPDSAKRAIRLLQEHEIIPVLATGRPEYEMRTVRESLGIDWAITCNGAHIGCQGRTVFGTPFSKAQIKEWVERAQNTDGHTLLLYGGQNIYSTKSIADCPYFSQADREIGFLEPLLVTRADELPDIYQCILFAPEEEEAPYLEHCADELYLHRWRPWALDLNPQGISKASGVKKLLEHFNLTPEQAAAFGDGNNDLEMIRYVGLGIAMGNSTPELLACAPHVTRHAREDGILYGVENLILQMQRSLR
jgi:Cof subfamily protein (haloacid dehalogenase superfamily)